MNSPKISGFSRIFVNSLSGAVTRKGYHGPFRPPPRNSAESVQNRSEFHEIPRPGALRPQGGPRSVNGEKRNCIEIGEILLDFSDFGGSTENSIDFIAFSSAGKRKWTYVSRGNHHFGTISEDVSLGLHLIPSEFQILPSFEKFCHTR